MHRLNHVLLIPFFARKARCRCSLFRREENDTTDWTSSEEQFPDTRKRRKRKESSFESKNFKERKEQKLTNSGHSQNCSLSTAASLESLSLSQWLVTRTTPCLSMINIRKNDMSPRGSSCFERISPLVNFMSLWNTKFRLIPSLIHSLFHVSHGIVFLA
jgi:hypothetical protein